MDLLVGDTAVGSVQVDNGSVLTGMKSVFLGNKATGDGTATITGANSSLDAKDLLSIGTEGTGTLNVQAGGNATANAAVVGNGKGRRGDGDGDGPRLFPEGHGPVLRRVIRRRDAQRPGRHKATIGDRVVLGNDQQAVGIVTVTGRESGFTVTQDLTVGASGSGTLNVQAGSKVSAAEASFGDGKGSIGMGTVAGSDSSLEVKGVLKVGVLGTGTLNVQAGGTVTSSGDTYLGNGKDGNTGNGTITVTGADSTFNALKNLAAGVTGTGTVNVQANGKLVVSGGGLLGSMNGVTGTLTVSGTNSTVNITNNLIVGKAGIGVLGVQAGGKLIVGKTLGLGDVAKSNGTATVSGAGSTINATEGVVVGNEGSGTLNVQTGGKVTGAGIVIGKLKGSTGMVTVTGANSTLELGGNVFVGQSGKGTLDLRAGGSLTTTKRVGIGATDANGEGRVTIVGDGSILKAEKVIVGGKGTGTLEITDKGMAEADVDVRANGTLNGKANVKGKVNNDGGTVAQARPEGRSTSRGATRKAIWVRS